MPRNNKVKKICFFVAPIGQPCSEDRKRADQVQRYVLREVLGAKYKIIRADELPQPGSITHQIIYMLYNADLVIADLTGSNANVAYELAVRHAFNKVAIHLIDKADQIPFDLKDERTIVFDLSDPDSTNECKEELKKYVNTIEKGKFEYSSPVFRTLGVAAATAEEKEGFLEKLADTVNAVASDVSSIELTLTMSDIDQIDLISETVSALEEQGEKVTLKLDAFGQTLKKILARLDGAK